MRTPVIIAGSGRSGTTWIQDQLASANSMRTLFEPLHPIGVRAARPLAYRYVSAKAQEPELKEFMDHVFYGDRHSMWADYRIRPDRFNFIAYGPTKALVNVSKFFKHYQRYGDKHLTGKVVKFIRANLMLPWLKEQYQFPTLLVVRHPCAVVASRFKLPDADWSAEKAIDRYRMDGTVCRLIGEVFGIDLSEPMSAAGAMACVWCIENVLPLRWAPGSGYSVVTYEKLLLDPEVEWPRIVRALQLSVVPERELLNAPSQQAALSMRNRTFTPKQLEKWREQLSSDDISAVERMLVRFKCTCYSVDSSLPLDLACPGANNP